MWQQVWEERGRSFRMLGVAQDVQGEKTVRPVVEERGITFPVLIDKASLLGRLLGFGIVPSGFFVDDRGVLRYRHVNDFEIGDPRIRMNLHRFLAGDEPEPIHEAEPMRPEALDLFAGGVGLFDQGRREEAVALWRKALELDPDNFVIRSQIWAVEHPEHFYPAVDREWQERQLEREGYGKPLP